MQITSLTPTHLDVVTCFVSREVCAPDFEGSQKDEFMALEQGGMTVASYEAKFHALSRYATQLVTTEEDCTKETRLPVKMTGLSVMSFRERPRQRHLMQ
uniref:'chromo' domain containing protein n=1 Tax=Solanum tuberosum TaxID=4113 RepID=M1BMB4_SOLTU